MMRLSPHRRVVAILFLAGAFSAPALAETLKPALTVEQLVSSVISYHPSVVAAHADLDGALGEWQAAEGGFDLNWKSRVQRASPGYYRNWRVDSVLEQPLSFSGMNLYAGWKLGRGDFAVYDLKALTGSEGELRAGIEIPLLRNRSLDRRRTNLRKAEMGREGAEAQYRQAALEVSRSAISRYWDWVAAGRKVHVQERLLQIAEDRDRWLASRVAHGDMPEFERRDNERSILQRRSALIQAQRDLARQAFELSNFLFDEKGGTKTPSREELPPEPASLTGSHAAEEQVEKWLELALKKRPEFARLGALRGQAEIEHSFAENQRLPSMQVQVGFSRDLGNRPYNLSYNELESAVLLEIPLQNRVAGGRERTAAAAELKAGQQLTLWRARVESEVRDAHAGWMAARERTQLTQQEWDLAVRLEKGERSRFESGDSTILTVNLREQATADAALRMIDAQAEFMKGRALLHIVSGEVPAGG